MSQAGPVRPGDGWPGDPATHATPVARDAAQVRALAAGAGTLAELTARQSVCRACPRLVAWREQVAVVRRRSFSGEQYWGRPVPGWGAERPAVLVVGLAPAAHGGNRTGRIFTGDRSGDVLFESLWRCGLATQPTSTAAGDGQCLIGVRMLAAVRCAPPENKPSIAERHTCQPWLAAELDLTAANLRVIVCLGHFAWQAIWRALIGAGHPVPVPRPVFGHGAEAMVPAGREPTGRQTSTSHLQTSTSQILILGCYHPSQQNTFTGRVTGAMLDAVFLRARQHAGLP